MKFKIKLIVVFLVLLGCSINLTAQIAYNDAVNLSETKKYSTNQVDPSIKFTLDPICDLEIFKILALYDKDLTEQSTIKDVINAYNKSQNPFIGFLEQTKSTPSTTTLYQQALANLPKSSGSAAMGILDTTTIVSGLSKFLIERFKEELGTAFFQKFKDEIIKDKYKIYRNLFPETFKMLETIDKEIYKFSSYIQGLHEALEKDLNNAFENFPVAFNGLMEVDKIRKFFEIVENKWLKAIFDSGFYMIKSLKNEKHPGDILAGFDTNILLSSNSQGSKNLGNVIELLKIISYSLRGVSGDRYWIDKDKLKKLFEKDQNKYVAFKIYLGLIYQKSKAIQFEVKESKDPISFCTVLKTLKKPINEIEDVSTKINDFMYKVDILESSLNELKKMIQNDYKPTFNDYFKLYNATLDTFEYSHELFEYFLKNGIPPVLDAKKYSIASDAVSEVKKYIGIVRAVGDIYNDINKKHYSSIVFNVIKIFDTVISPASEEDFLKIRASLLKYGTFMAAMANAKNSDEVKEAIQAVVLPAGSASIKRNSSFNISLNAYLGPSAFTDKSSDGKRIVHARVWAPIGIACSFGKINFPGKECAFIKSVTLFASIIDIGAVTAFQFRNELESDKKIPKFTFKNIVSPGLHAVLGIKNLPISFGIGCQRLPQLREVTINKTEGNETTIETKIITDNLWKWNFFIAVDIPLLNFMTK